MINKIRRQTYSS